MASPLTSFISAETNRVGRLDVGEHLRVRGVEEGDAAEEPAAPEGRVAMQSCRRALPQGKFAGYHVAADRRPGIGCQCRLSSTKFLSTIIRIPSAAAENVVTISCRPRNCAARPADHAW